MPIIHLRWKALPAFFKHNNSSVATVHPDIQKREGRKRPFTVRVTITRYWFETALDYKPRILGSKIEEFSCLVHKFSVVLIALQYKPQWNLGQKIYKPRLIMARVRYIVVIIYNFQRYLLTFLSLTTIVYKVFKSFTIRPL